MPHTQVTRSDGRYIELVADLDVVKSVVFQSNGFIAQPGLLGKAEIANIACHALPPGNPETDLLIFKGIVLLHWLYRMGTVSGMVLPATSGGGAGTGLALRGVETALASSTGSPELRMRRELTTPPERLMVKSTTTVPVAPFGLVPLCRLR